MLFHCISLTFRKELSILNRILRSSALSEGNRFIFMENPGEDMCQEKDTFSKISLKYLAYLLKKKHVKNA